MGLILQGLWSRACSSKSNFSQGLGLGLRQLETTGRAMDRGLRVRPWNGVLAMAACCVGLLGAVAQPAAGATWNSRQLAGDSTRLPMFGISCPTASLCVTVGGGNTIASSTRPTRGSGEWKVTYPGSGAGEPNQRQIRSVSCPTAQLCVAVAFEGLVYTSTDPTGGAGAWQVADLTTLGPNVHLYGVSCPTVSFCAASAGDAKILTTTNPTGGAGAWQVAQLEGPMELRGISCASAAFCVAVGDDGDNIRPEIGDQGEIVTSAAPGTGPWSKAPLPGHGNLFGVACPSTGFCISGDSLGNLLFATNPTGGGSAWHQTAGGGSVQITDTECVSPALCLAIDNNGDILTSLDPTGGPADWSFTNIAPFPGLEETGPNHFFGASCASREFCAISGNGGMVYTSNDPFAAEPPSAAGPGAKGKKKNKNKKRPKRPRVMFARLPAPLIESSSGHKVQVMYRFFVPKQIQARGFVCKLDRRPMRRCRSPKTYRAGLGHHVFRVRAIGWTGLRGPAAVHRFQVCRQVGALPHCLR